MSEIMTDEELNAMYGNYISGTGGIPDIRDSHLAANALIAELRREIMEQKRRCNLRDAMLDISQHEIAVRDRAMVLICETNDTVASLSIDYHMAQARAEMEAADGSEKTE